MGDGITHRDRLKYRAALIQGEVDVLNASIDMYAFIETKKEKPGKEDGGTIMACKWKVAAVCHIWSTDCGSVWDND